MPINQMLCETSGALFLDSGGEITYYWIGEFSIVNVIFRTVILSAVHVVLNAIVFSFIVLSDSAYSSSCKKK